MAIAKVGDKVAPNELLRLLVRKKYQWRSVGATLLQMDKSVNIEEIRFASTVESYI